MNQTLESHRKQDGFNVNFNLSQSLFLWGSKAPYLLLSVHFIVETMLHIGILMFRFLGDYLIWSSGKRSENNNMIVRSSFQAESNSWQNKSRPTSSKVSTTEV